MSRSNRGVPFKEIIILGFIFYVAGWNGIKTLFIVMWEMLKLLNVITITIDGDSILTKFFCYGMSFVIIGLLFKALVIEKGPFGKYAGIVMYFLVSAVMGTILNFAGMLLF